MFLHICFVSLCVCGRVSLQRRANIEVTGIYKKTAKTAVLILLKAGQHSFPYSREAEK